MPSLKVEIVREAFRFLVEDEGFAGPHAGMLGTDYVIKYRNDERGLSIDSMDMGSSFPFGYALRYQNATSDSPQDLFDLDDLAKLWGISFHYPIRDQVYEAWFPKSFYLRWKLRAERQQEYNKRVEDLALLVKTNVNRLWDRNNPKAV